MRKAMRLSDAAVFTGLQLKKISLAVNADLAKGCFIPDWSNFPCQEASSKTKHS